MADQRTNIVAFVVRNLTPYRVNFLEQLASDLSEYRIVAVVTNGFPNQPWKPLAPAGVAVIEVPRPDAGKVRRLAKLWSAWNVGGSILAILEVMQPAVAVVHGYDDPAHMRVIRECHRGGIPVVLRGDSNVRADERKSPLRRGIKRWGLRMGFRYVDAFMPVGSNGRAYFQSYGARDDGIFIIPIEPLYTLFESTPSPADITEFQTTHGLEPTRSRILYAGRLVPAKRVDKLIDAFAKIAEMRPTWDLLVVGDGPLRPSLETLVPCRLRDRVFWTGFLTPERLRLAHASSSVFVLPSDSEPWGIVVNEAIAAGLAPVISDVVGAGADLVPDAECGWVFAHNDHNSLVRTLGEATNDGEAAKRNAKARRRLRQFREVNSTTERMNDMLAYVRRRR